MSNNIKNIIFDLGGVLLNIDYDKTIREFEKLGNDKFETLYSQASQNNLFDLFETGKISEKQFVEEIKKLLPPNIEDHEIINAWNAMLLDLPMERVAALLEIGKNYNIVLLSNTNETHIRAFSNIILEQNNLYSLDLIFNKVYFSNVIKMRKPNKNAFQFVMDDNTFKNHETLFFDDSIQHVVGAKEAGINAVHVKSNKTILDFFDNDFKLKTILS